MKKLFAASLLMSLSSFCSAADLYDAKQSYEQGEQVTFENAIYEAQWYANQNQSPADITENAWESPWVYIVELQEPDTETGTGTESNPEYVQIMNDMHKKMTLRLAELRRMGADPDYYFYKDDGEKYIELDGIHFKITEDGNPFAPMLSWDDDSGNLALFPFFDTTEWDLVQLEGGVIAVNNKFGNWDWGNACLLEYLPYGHLETNNLLKDTSTCFDGSNPDLKPLD